MATELRTCDRIARLRWRGGGDALAARRALERALAAFAWQPEGAAIVCVRCMRGALQRSGDLAGRDGRPWRDGLEALAARAPRPWREPVPANAEAVVFADEAELLACLALDVAQGRAGAAWWWPALLGSCADRAQWWRRWTATPELLPTVLRRLAARGEAATVLAALAPAELQELARRVAAAFAVDWAPRPAGDPSESVAATSAWTASARQEAQAVVAQVQATLGGEADAEMPHATRLLALALALSDRPRLAGMSGFAALLQHALSQQPVDGFDSRPSHRREIAATQPLSAASQRVPRQAAGAVAPTFAPTPSSATAWGPSAIAPVTERAWPLAATPTRAAEAAATAVPGGSAALPRELGAPGSESPRFAPERAAGSEPSRLHADSACAGALYMLPVAVHLGWYGDFTQPRARGLALHPADLLDLLAQHVLGAPWATDPLPALLAAWAGRGRDEPPGRDFVPPHGQALAAWVAERADELAVRAADALGEPAAAVLPWLACRAGRVSLSDAELVARFDLASHPLAIRLAGLDRDLGWLPAGGRIVRFQFDLLAAP